MTDLLFCSDMASNFNLEHDCCDTCHDDGGEGYHTLWEREIKGMTYRVCCTMKMKYDDKYGLNDD